MRRAQTGSNSVQENASTFLLHHLQSLQSFTVKVLQVLGPAALNEDVLLEQRGCWGLVIL